MFEKNGKKWAVSLREGDLIALTETGPRLAVRLIRSGRCLKVQHDQEKCTCMLRLSSMRLLVMCYAGEQDLSHKRVMRRNPLHPKNAIWCLQLTKQEA